MDRKAVEIKIESLLHYLKEELSKIRTGRANSSIVEDIQVECYGSRQPIKALGTIRSLDPQTLVIEPWDKNSIEAIASAITKAQNGLSAVPEGERVRIPFPPLSEERRKEFIRLSSARAEDTKIALRKLRDETMKELERAEKAKEISEDEQFRQKERCELKFKDANATIENLKDQKEKELSSKQTN